MKRIFVYMTFCLFFSMNVFAVDIDDISYSLDIGTRSATVTGSTLANVVVPETILYNDVTYTVTTIGLHAFEGNEKIVSIKTGNTIKTLGEKAFFGATNLQKVDFGNSLETIEIVCFKQCTNLKYLVIPQSIKCIYSTLTFSDCGVTIICLKEGFNTTVPTQTIYPSSFFTFANSPTDYNGKVPEINYAFNGIGFGFQPTAVNLDALVATAGTHTSSLKFSISNTDMSFDVEIPYTYTINPITLTAQVKDASRQYGDANPQFTTTYSGFVNNEDASVVTSHGSYTTTATAKSDVGTYAIKQSGATAQNYVFEYEDGTLTVGKAPLIMTANNKIMAYGDKLPTLNASYEGLKNNETQPAWTTEPEFTTTATSASKVGTYPITINNADAKNYQLTVNNGTLTIEKAELTVSADSKSRKYGDENPEFTLTYTGLKNSETVPEWEKEPTVETTADVKSPVGTYDISVKDAVAVNYAITAVDGKLTINKAALQVTPKDATREYGEENPQFELLYTGLKNNETVPEWTTDPVITTQATATSTVGDYAIQVASAVAKNYALQFGIGKLTVTKAPLEVAIQNYTRKYGEANPAFEMTYMGLKNGETSPAWTTAPTITTEATTSSGVGVYSITATGGVLKNYEMAEIAQGTLTITPASLVVKAQNASRLYFEDNPEFTFTCVGLVGDDTEAVLTTQPTISTTAMKNSNVGTYPIEISGAESVNYSISYEKGTLSVNKRNLTVSTKNYTREYNEENPKFELTYSGFVNGEDASVLLVKPKATTEAKADTDVGVYDIIIKNGVAENYDFTYIGGKLTIEKAYQTLTWNQNLSGIKKYEQIELLATATSGLEITYTIEGEPIGSIVKIGKKQYLDCTSEGEAVIIAIQNGNNNYWQTTKIYKSVIAGPYEPVYTLKGDVNGDGVVSITDAVAVVNIILNGGE